MDPSPAPAATIGRTPLAANTGNDELAAALVTSTLAEHPALTGTGRREQLLAAAWLAAHPAPRTRRAYAADLAGWLTWLADHQVDVLGATRLHVDLWVRAQTDTRAAASTITRRISALSSFYRHTTSHGLTAANPAHGVRRPRVDPDHTTTVGLDRDQARGLLHAADSDPGPQRLRTAAAVRLLLHNALRVDELAAADITDLGHDRGHRILRLTRKGGRRATAPLAPATTAALDAYLAQRSTQAGVPVAALGGPLLATAPGHRLDQAALWHLVRRLAHTAGIPRAGTSCRP